MSADVGRGLLYVGAALFGFALLGVSVAAASMGPYQPPARRRIDMYSDPPSPPAPPAGAPPPVPPAGEPAAVFSFTGVDEDAAARMIASENPSASEEVWVEQIHTQIRSRKEGQSLYMRITGGHGYGEQGKVQGGGARPVSTSKPAKEIHKRVARETLAGLRPSKLPGARKFFDPGEQDAVMRQLEKGKKDLAAGRPVSDRTRELIAVGYQRTAEGVREKWRKEGAQVVGTVGPVEFWS